VTRLGLISLVTFALTTSGVTADTWAFSDTDAESTASLSKERLIVVYSIDPSCNGATKVALRLTALGFPGYVRCRPPWNPCAAFNRTAAVRAPRNERSTS